MAELKITINDPKTGKSYNKVMETMEFKGKKVFDKISGDFLGLKGYELEIKGGSDKSGFPIRPNVEGQAKRRGLFTGGVGVTVKRKGQKIRKTVRGNQLGPEIVQVNLKIIKYGAKKVEEILGEVKEDSEASAEAPKEENQKENSKK